MDALHALSSLRESGLVNFVGADIVEFNPSRDVNGVTAMTTAKIARAWALLHGSTITWPTQFAITAELISALSPRSTPSDIPI